MDVEKRERRGRREKGREGEGGREEGKKGEALEEGSGGRKAEVVFVDRAGGGRERKASTKQRQVSQQHRCVLVVVNYQQETMLCCARVMPSRGLEDEELVLIRTPSLPDPVRRPPEPGLHRTLSRFMVRFRRWNLVRHQIAVPSPRPTR